MGKLYPIAVLVVLAVLLSSVSFGQIPRMMSYQGVLLDAQQQPVPDGQYTMTFSLYSTESGGGPLWSEIQANVQVHKGIFNVTLGDRSPINIAFGAGLWLGIRVGGEPELAPRIRLTTSPYAFQADDANRVGTYAASPTPAPNTLLPLDVNAKFPPEVVPSGLPPGGTAGGDLTGSYPSPSIAAGAVTHAKLATNAVMADKIAAHTITGDEIDQSSHFIISKLDAGGSSFPNVCGVYGESAGYGVMGACTGTNNYAMIGTPNEGIYARAENQDKTGVLALASGGHGIGGFSTAAGYSGLYGGTYSAAGSGLYAYNYASYTEAVLGSDQYGAYGEAPTGTGVAGYGYTGVVGESPGTSGNGVWGAANNGPNAWGVHGESTDGIGVHGYSGNVGVWGDGETGVYGQSSVFDGQGVFGYGSGQVTEGVIGAAEGTEAVGVYGLANAYIPSGETMAGLQGDSRYGQGVLAWSQYGTALAADGNFYASGTKSAQVKLDDGREALLYSEEATEVHFSDYGEGRLSGGRAHIELDQYYLQTVTVDERHPMRVFVQLEGDCNGVFVSDKTSTSFDVVELRSGASNVPFTYRVVCKRKYFEDVRLSTEAEVNALNTGMQERVWPEVIAKHQAKAEKVQASVEKRRQPVAKTMPKAERPILNKVSIPGNGKP